jgi:cyanophycinase-like exopeptidase
MKPLLLITGLFWLSSMGTALAQGGYTNWIVGDTSDAIVSGVQAGTVLAGGGGDNDDAMQWMLQRAAGGDVLVLRASGGNGYNNYFFSQLGVQVNSVETIRFDGPQAAFDPYVLRRIEEAELLFLAGGDQYQYYQYWKDTPVADAINTLIQEKGITVGGTSAGMMVLSGAYYAPSGSAINSAIALSDPHNSTMDVLGKGDFLHAPFLAHTIADTHFDQRTRAGRLMAFLARLTQTHGGIHYGIACNEYVALCIDENGLGRVFGEHPQYPEDLAYVLQVNCQAPFEPEVCEPGEALHWYRNGYAVRALAIPGTMNGSNTIDLNDYHTHSGGSWQRWFVENGELTQMEDLTEPDCTPSLSGEVPASPELRLHPNPLPAGQALHLTRSQAWPENARLELYDLHGRLLQLWQLPAGETGFLIAPGQLPSQPGVYVLRSSLGDTVRFIRL